MNPYIALKSGGHTNHYYIKGQRIVSKLGVGCRARRSRDRLMSMGISIVVRRISTTLPRTKAGDNNGKGTLKAGGSEVDYVGRSQKVFDGIVKNLKFLGADGQILTAGKSGKVPPGQVIS